MIDRIIKCTDLDECKCLKLGDTYTFILGKCYYVEISLLNYYDAIVNCQNQFGYNHSGKLFEPSDLAINNLVTNYAYGIRNNRFWLGINEIVDIEGTFQYATGGNLVFTNWEVGQPDNVPGNDCVQSMPISEPWKGKWDDYSCDTKRSSICEMTLDGNLIH